LTILIEVPSVAAQAPFEIGSLTLKLAAHLLSSARPGQDHDVELVEDDPGVDHAVVETPLQEIASSQMQPAASTAISVSRLPS
jgi:hypothetical protein